MIPRFPACVNDQMAMMGWANMALREKSAILPRLILRCPLNIKPDIGTGCPSLGLRMVTGEGKVGITGVQIPLLKSPRRVQRMENLGQDSGAVRPQTVGRRGGTGDRAKRPPRRGG